MINPLSVSLLTMILFFAGFTNRVQAATITAPSTKSQPAAMERRSTGAILAVPQVTAAPPTFGALPGEFAIRTWPKKFYLTARDGGRHTVDAIVTTATTAGTFEKFKFEKFQPNYILMKTSGGYYVSAYGGKDENGDDTKFQTERASFTDTELLRIETNFGGGAILGTMRTNNGYFITALDGGGRSTRAFITSVTKKADAWELFQVQKCGDLGSGYPYVIVPKNDGVHTLLGDSVKLIRQSDGSYAMSIYRGHYVTARGGGGLAGVNITNALEYNRTEVQAWEKFRIVEQGSCTYTIQTANNWFVANSLTGKPISTRISFPAQAPSVGYNAYFELMPLLW